MKRCNLLRFYISMTSPKLSFKSDIWQQDCMHDARNILRLQHNKNCCQQLQNCRHQCGLHQQSSTCHRLGSYLHHVSVWQPSSAFACATTPGGGWKSKEGELQLINQLGLQLDLLFRLIWTLMERVKIIWNFVYTRLKEHLRPQKSTLLWTQLVWNIACWPMDLRWWK